jgi:hypothetical protein
MADDGPYVQICSNLKMPLRHAESAETYPVHMDMFAMKQQKCTNFAITVISDLGYASVV